MASRKNIDDMNEAVRKGKKFMRIDEAKDFFSVGKHTVEKWAKDAKAVYKINGVKLVKRAGINKIPAIVKEMTNDDAIIAMVDSNLQGEEIFPSERAFSFKILAI